MITGLTVFDNFYESLRWSNPAMLALMHDDLAKVAMGGMAGNRQLHYSAVIRLRERAQGLPTPMAMILDHILTVDLGYSLTHLEQVRQTSIAMHNARRSREIHGV